jgi:hypothetical protein
VTDDFRKHRPARVRTGTEGMKQHTVTWGAGDDALVELIMERLGCTKADAVRTAIRVYSAILMQQK